MPKLSVQAEGHWRGDPDAFCGRLLIEVKATADAAALAKLARLLKDGDPEKLAFLADAAERIEAAHAEQTELAGC